MQILIFAKNTRHKIARSLEFFYSWFHYLNKYDRFYTTEFCTFRQIGDEEYARFERVCREHKIYIKYKGDIIENNCKLNSQNGIDLCIVSNEVCSLQTFLKTITLLFDAILIQTQNCNANSKSLIRKSITHVFHHV